MALRGRGELYEEGRRRDKGCRMRDQDNRLRRIEYHGRADELLADIELRGRREAGRREQASIPGRATGQEARGTHVVEQEHGRVDAAAREVDRGGRLARRGDVDRRVCRRSKLDERRRRHGRVRLARAAAADVVDRDVVAEDEAELLLVLALELARKVGRPGRLQRLDERVSAGVAQVEEALDRDLALLLAEALGLQLLADGSLERVEPLEEARQRLRRVVGRERPAERRTNKLSVRALDAGGRSVGFGDALLRLVHPVGESEAVGREDGRVAVDDDARDAERLRHLAGRLPAGAAERAEDVLGEVEAARFGQRPDRPAHALVGHWKRSADGSTSAAGSSWGERAYRELRGTHP